MSKRNLVVFSGAGLSKESGIPTFRDAQDGLWEQHRIEDVATPEGWARDPGLVLRFYEARMTNMMSCQPNPAHLALARLEQKHSVFHVTQNIDDLLERSGCSNVTHVHGSAFSRRCENHTDGRNGFLLEAFGPSHYTCDYKAPQTEAVKLSDRCPKCAAQLRPDIVWFGEPVNELSPFVTTHRPLADVFIVVGTSAVVYPAAELIHLFADTPERHFVNLEDQHIPGYEKHIGPASQTLPALVERLLA